MTTSGTYTFAPPLAELGLYAFNLCEVRSTSLTQEHMESLRMAANLLLADWSNKGVNLWAVDLQTINLVQGTATYSIPPETVMILDAYYTVTAGQLTTNRIILPVSRTEFASYPQPAMQGAPTTFWFDRLLTAPTINLYPTPDGNEQTLMYYRVRRLQDANLVGGQNVEVPYLWMAAFAYGLGEHLSISWKPEKTQLLAAYATKFYQTAADQNVETSQFYISPLMSGYFR